jgi:hypothetical protein
MEYSPPFLRLLVQSLRASSSFDKERCAPTDTETPQEPLLETELHFQEKWYWGNVSCS